MRVDPTSLVAGGCVLVLGVVLLLDATEAIDLRLAAFGPLAFAALGAILVASGMTRPR